MIGQIIKQNIKLFFKCWDDIGWFGLGSGSIREETLHSHMCPRTMNETGCYIND